MKKELLPDLELRMGKKVNEHLGFYGELKDYGELYVKYSENPKETGCSKGAHYLGEWSKDRN